ncbi:hypothetical protein CU098_011235 [Rhizopus stolonifer]|uniref:Homeobox domain-containing protein n=1 Tax=Rhizopus stolonifer TaxID=4846 RepID=A0A367K9I6_RHIST|nr:hypothetical protein CU098_011235 [Rhizopus stolonifer]
METKQFFTPIPTTNLTLSTKAKRRMRTSREETAILESYYKQNPNPNQEQKQEIAEAVKMGVRNVHFWFQNRRAKDNKRKKLIKQKEFERLHLKQQQADSLATSSINHIVNKNNSIPKRNSNLKHQQQSFVSHPVLLNYEQVVNGGECSNNDTNDAKEDSLSPAQRQKGKFKLPPISTFMTPKYAGLSVPFYFHHPNFGIEDSMIQLAYLRGQQQNY